MHIVLEQCAAVFRLNSPPKFLRPYGSKRLSRARRDQGWSEQGLRTQVSGTLCTEMLWARIPASPKHLLIN
jgi:hypothetical protein